MRNSSFFFPIAFGLFAGYIIPFNNEVNDTEILYLATAYTAGWSLDSTTIEMQINEASLFCNDIGGRLQVIETRTTAPKEIGRLSAGDIQLLCIKPHKSNRSIF
jgi:hypothetical protein